MIRHAALVLALAATTTATWAGAVRPTIAELEVRREGSQLRAAWVVDAEPSEETLERIHSGIPVTYRHRVEIVSRRGVPLWPAKTVGRAQSEATVRYDPITRRYGLTRSVRTHGTRGDDDVIHEPERETESLDEARRWLTFVDHLPALDVPPLPRLRVRVRSALGRQLHLWVFPGRVTATAVRRLES